jgi:ribosomal protein S27AE
MLALSPLPVKAIPVTERVALPHYQGSIMQKSYWLPEHVNVELQRPACPKCSTRMMLARITPARVGFDLRTFECPRCDHVHVVMVATEAFGMSLSPPAHR